MYHLPPNDTCSTTECGIIPLMLSLRGLQFLKVALLSAFAVFGLSLNHVALTNTSSMTDMGGHGSSVVQCQGVCNSGLPGNKQEGLLQVERNDESPEPAAYIAASLLTLVVLTFVVKVLSLLSSWRPPDLVALCGHYADGL